MLRGLTERLDDCDARGNGGEGAAGGHCGLTFEDFHSNGVMLVQMLCSPAQIMLLEWCNFEVHLEFWNLQTVWGAER